jgi:GTP-binding protein
MKRDGKPIVAIVGRPNVGKSTLFNRLIGKRRALVDAAPGVTRDRRYGEAEWGGKRFLLIDTGGFEPQARGDEIMAVIQRQVQVALEEADLVLFVLDGKEGITPTDRELADRLRRQRKSSFLIVNKIDGPKQEGAAIDFFELGAPKIFPVSALHGYGISDLLDEMMEQIPAAPMGEEEEEDFSAVRVAVVGRPNVGKSSLINMLLREDRLAVSPVPGTTTDAVDTVLRWGDKSYTLIDTAGIRRKARVSLRYEAYSIVEALRSIDQCHVSLIMMDALEGITEQDTHIAGYTQERGRGAIILLNKWDLVPREGRTFDQYTRIIRQRLPFISYAPVISVSALTGQRVDRIFGLVDQVMEHFTARVDTGPLNRALGRWQTEHPPGTYRGRSIKLFYMSQVSVAPPTFVVFTNAPGKIHFSYRRFIINHIRNTFGITLSPIQLVFRQR